ncbi:ribose-phosphate diphosphokinase [Candidatus Woesearchaeota archaeon]|nr:ribose-phosphate diphosphokinase [Candidatus Woesearchaeota archaeon]
MTRGKLSIIACESGRPFAKKIVNEIIKKKGDIKFISSNEIKFADSERKTVIKESIRGADVYIIQDVRNSANEYSVDENLRALKTAIDAAWRSDVSYITAVIPVFPYARQDKQEGREGITAAAVAREIEDVNADHVITLDVHNEAIAGFFRKAKFENLHASKNIIDYIKKNKDDFDLKNLVVMSPDVGGARRAKHYAKMLGVNLILAYKDRNYNAPNSIESIQIVGEVKGKDVLIVDDMIDTAETLINVVKKAKEKGAKKVYVACSLALFNGPAIERIKKAYEERYLIAVIGTDAVYHGEDFQEKNPWYKEVSVASYFAEVIILLNQHKSISKLLE